jgi:hypothetical protein
MKTIRIAAACAVMLIVGQGWAQGNPEVTQTAQPAQDVGGVTDSPKGDAGMPAMAAPQPHQNLGDAQPSAGQDRMTNGLFLHH